MTALTSERYIPGVVALSRALQSVNSLYPLTVLIPADKSENLMKKFREYGKQAVKSVQFVKQKRIEVNAPQLQQKYDYWAETFFKLTAANCIEFDKIVLLDSDMLVLHNLDHLFEKPHMSAVMAGICERPSWKNFNSGMLVIKPHEAFFTQLEESVVPAINRKSGGGG
jgi:alpha-N-acetylglucosamine transferase